MPNTAHTVCAACDSVNLVDLDHVDPVQSCKLCRRALFRAAAPGLDESRFWHHLERSDLPLAVALLDQSRPADREIASRILPALARLLEPRTRLVDIEAGSVERIRRRFGAGDLPVLLVFRKGRLAARLSDLGLDPDRLAEAIEGAAHTAEAV